MMKKTIALCTLLAAGTSLHANEQEATREAMLQEVTAHLAALDMHEENHLARDLAMGGAAVGAGGAALVALKRGDVTELRGMLSDLSAKISGQHSLIYPTWLPSAAGWGVLGLVGLSVYQQVRIGKLATEARIVSAFLYSQDTKIDDVITLMTKRKKSATKRSAPKGSVRLEGDQHDNDNL